MLGIVGFLALAMVLSIVVYKVFFAFRKKHIGSGNIFYVCTDGQFQNTLERSKDQNDNLRILAAKLESGISIQEAILVHEFTNREQPFAHKVLVQGMPVGYLQQSIAEALKQEKEALGIHASVIYSKVKITTNQAGKVDIVAIDLPPIHLLSKVLSNRSFEHSLEKYLKLRAQNKV